MAWNNDLMFSSASTLWDTPEELSADLAIDFDFDLDVCASRPNICENYFSEADNGLARTWARLNWCNPPYGRGEQGCAPWLEKGAEQFYNYFSTTIFLIPARTDTLWFQGAAASAATCQLVFLKGRLKFGSLEAWALRYNEAIIKKKARGTLQKLIKKIGGVHCSEAAKLKIQTELFPRYAAGFFDWLKADHLKPDPAPFPSAFLVMGQLSLKQRSKLAAYGLSFGRSQQLTQKALAIEVARAAEEES